jgi:hypothetical protein
MSSPLFDRVRRAAGTGHAALQNWSAIDARFGHNHVLDIVDFLEPSITNGTL